ncbi:MAG: hypothetical protein ABMB14_15535 [Myxococcota bacterium]
MRRWSVLVVLAVGCHDPSVAPCQTWSMFGVAWAYRTTVARDGSPERWEAVGGDAPVAWREWTWDAGVLVTERYNWGAEGEEDTTLTYTRGPGGSSCVVGMWIRPPFDPLWVDRTVGQPALARIAGDLGTTTFSYEPGGLQRLIAVQTPDSWYQYRYADGAVYEQWASSPAGPWSGETRTEFDDGCNVTREVGPYGTVEAEYAEVDGSRRLLREVRTKDGAVDSTQEWSYTDAGELETELDDWDGDGVLDAVYPYRCSARY